MDLQTTQGYSTITTTIVAKDCFGVTTINMGFINIKIDFNLKHLGDNYHFTIANSSQRQLPSFDFDCVLLSAFMNDLDQWSSFVNFIDRTIVKDSDRMLLTSSSLDLTSP